ncbi:hypothetical protein HPB47_003777 [Ixodes persulcatus]|uniref:Uncharacterized protein n=1 Tax=Ixodes persulcatus TaxID=34615 RepID=A0AC60PII9_IXOPE|nr:hypothetical protein HPB47_003777 [Ixodes persulcatus]
MYKFLHRLRLRPRVLRNVAERRIEVTLLGDQKLSMPVGISPTAFQKMAHPEGEIAVAKAAQAAGTLMTLSSFSNHSLEDVQRGAPGGLRWFQLHVFRDRKFTRNLVERADRSGYRALVLTVDMPVEGQRDFDKMSDFCIPEHLSELTGLESCTLPFPQRERGRPHRGAIEVLPDIVSAVRGRVEVYLDGGVRRGTDVVKALALGAKAVFIGRPALWGLAYNGEAGVRQTLEILREELDRALALMAGTESVTKYQCVIFYPDDAEASSTYEGTSWYRTRVACDDIMMLSVLASSCLTTGQSSVDTECGSLCHEDHSATILKFSNSSCDSYSFSKKQPEASFKQNFTAESFGDPDGYENTRPRRAGVTVDLNASSAPADRRDEMSAGGSYLRSVPRRRNFPKATRESPTQDSVVCSGVDECRRVVAVDNNV